MISLSKLEPIEQKDERCTMDFFLQSIIKLFPLNMDALDCSVKI